MPIARRRAALERQVQGMLNIVATLSEIAKTKKDSPSHRVHTKLRQAQKKLADRKAKLAKLDAE